jgi:spore coat protein H
MKQIPGLVSLRTQFVQLYVKDETSEPEGTAFVDYGLFTQVELPNKAFLKAHLLNSNGQLYKTTFFEFSRYPEQIRLVDDPLFDENIFSSKLEIKGNRDNTKLIKMLDNLNNYEIPIETTFEKYFDAENYFTWMAYNILVGNVDTSSQNFYLYSPQNSDKFYFIPWDYDDSFFRQDREACCGYFPYSSYEYGVANYWGTTLANRVLRSPVYRKILDTKMLELRDFLSPERINGLLNSYMGVVEKYALAMPDLQYFPTTKEGMKRDIELIPTEININYNLYLESLQTPLPFFLGTPNIVDGVLSFNWGSSYNFVPQEITYHFVLAKDLALLDIIYDKELLNNLNLQTSIPEPGEYYWTVTATNSSGKVQLPFNGLRDSDNRRHSGIKRFYISVDGQILEK